MLLIKYINIVYFVNNKNNLKMYIEIYKMFVYLHIQKYILWNHYLLHTEIN